MNNFDNAQFMYDAAMPPESLKEEFIELYGDQFATEEELDQAWLDEMKNWENNHEDCY